MVIVQGFPLSYRSFTFLLFCRVILKQFCSFLPLATYQWTVVLHPESSTATQVIQG